MSQLGVIRVGQGHLAEGFALIDEAMAAALAGERSNLDTVVYACCDMLNACELASDLERAAQWCRVADEFVDTYGCPFLYAECRLYYGSVLVAKGRWEDADRELRAGVRITEGACPGLHARALTRLAGLRIRQGRLEDAAHILSGVDVDGEAEATLSLAAMLLARGDAQAASRQLAQRLQHVAEHRMHLAYRPRSGDRRVSRRRRPGGGPRPPPSGSPRSAGGADSRTARGAGRECPRTGVARRGCLRGGGRRTAVRSGGVVTPGAAVRAGTRCQYELGRVLVDTAFDVAVDHLRRSLSDFEHLGAALDADRVAALLRTLGVPARTGAKGVGQLTDREQQVLRLVCRRSVQPRDRSATARQPQDGGAPRESHPHQAEPAQPGRGRGARIGRVGGSPLTTYPPE